MKRFTRWVCFFLFAVMLLTTPAFAAESVTPRSSNYFLCSSVYLHKISERSFEAWFSVDALDRMDELGASVIKIQRSSDGENWITMRTYTKEAYPELICENTGAHTACVTYVGGTVGFYYRAFVTLYAKKGNGIGEVDEYTSVMEL